MIDTKPLALEDQFTWHLTSIAQHWAAIDGIAPATRCLGLLHSISRLLDGDRGFPKVTLTAIGRDLEGSFTETIRALIELKTNSHDVRAITK